MTIIYDTANAKFLEEIMSVGKPKSDTPITILGLNEATSDSTKEKQKMTPAMAMAKAHRAISKHAEDISDGRQQDEEHPHIYHRDYLHNDASDAENSISLRHTYNAKSKKHSFHVQHWDEEGELEKTKKFENHNDALRHYAKVNGH